MSSVKEVCGEMAIQVWLYDGGRTEEEKDAVEGEGEWWLCWIMSGRWCMRPFFSGGPRPEPGEEEEGDEAMTNRFMSAVLWKQEQADLGWSKLKIEWRGGA